MTLETEASETGSAELESSANPEASQTQAGETEQVIKNPEFLSKWNEVFGGNADAGQSEEATATPAEESAPIAKATEDAEGSDTIPAPKTPAAKGGKEEATSTLSPILKHAASRAGWSPDDIKAFYDQNPELAERTFERLHSSYNDLSSRFAQLGTSRPQQTPQEAFLQPAPGAPPASGVPADLSALFSPEGMKKFAEVNGQDLTDQLVKPLATQLWPQLQEAMAFIAQQKAEVTKSQVNQTMSGLEKEFPEVYGKTGEVLAAEQIEARREMYKLADQIRAGANLQGVDMSIPEAIDRAHLVFIAPKRAEIERKVITAAIKKRSGSITAKPTQRRPIKALESGQKSIEAAMEAYAARAGELNHNIDQ